MNSPRQCGKCGRPLPAQALEGLCPNCLLEVGALELGMSSELPPADSKFQDWESGSGSSSGRIFGNYELLEKIGQGGMGVVYRARQINLSRLVAVKLLPFSQFSREDLVQRFRTEAAAAAALRHPNIVAIHDVGEHEGQHYFSMDLIAGHTLAEAVREQPLPARRAAAYLKTIAEAVQYAHEHGVLHRDLKPSNVLIDESEQPHITDFGLAKRLSSPDCGMQSLELTFTGQVLGSPNFISPEQAEGRPHAIGPAADIYSLGALLYHLLTRQPPFQADTLTTLLKQVVETDPLAPRLLNPSIPHDLETICLKCLEKEPSHRYPTALAMAEDLGRYLESKPISARPVGPAAKAWKWCRRRPALAGMTAAALVILMLGLSGVLWQWRRATRNAQEKQASEYAADMRLAQLALANNRPLAVGLVKKYAAKSGRGNPKSESEARGWEWRFLWELCRGDELRTLHRYQGSINALAISKGGAVLAVATPEEVALWNLRSEPEQPMAQLPVPGARSLAFAPEADLLAVGTWNVQREARVELWNTRTIQRERVFPHEREVRSVAFSPDGALLASFDTRGKVRILDSGSGQPFMPDVPIPQTRYVSAGAVRFSPDGQRLAIGQEYGPFQFVNLRTKSLVPLNTGSENPIDSLAFSPQSDLLASGFGYGDGTIRIWDGQSGQLRGELLGHTDEVNALAFSPDGQRLISASQDGTVRVWSVADRIQLGPPLQSTREKLTSLVLLPDGTKLVTGGEGGSVCVWDWTVQKHAPVYTNVAVSTDLRVLGQIAPAGFEEETLDPRVVRRFGVSFTPDSASFITLNRAGGLTLWDARSLQWREDLPTFGSNHWAVALSPDGCCLATGDFPDSITIWNWANRHAVTNFTARPANFFGRLSFSPNGHYLMAQFVPADLNTRYRIWRTAGWDEVPLTGDAFAGLWCLDIAPDDQLLAAGYRNGAVRLFQFPSRRLEANVTQHQAGVPRVRFSPDGRMLLSAGFDRSIRVWDVAARRQRRELLGHSAWVVGGDFSPDGKRLATGGISPTDAVKLWDLNSGRELLSLQGEGCFFFDVGFSPDGNILTATSFGSVTHLWRAPSPEEIENASSGSRTE